MSVLQSEGTYYDPAQYGELVQAMFKNSTPRVFAVATYAETYAPGRSDAFDDTIVMIVADDTSSGSQELLQGTRAVGFTLGKSGEDWHIVHIYIGDTGAFLDYEAPGPDDTWVRDYFSAWERWEPAG